MSEILIDNVTAKLNQGSAVVLDSYTDAQVVETTPVLQIHNDQFVLSSGGMYGNGNGLIGAIPTWLIDAINEELTVGDGNITDMMDALELAMDSLSVGVSQIITSINTDKLSQNALTTAIKSQVEANHAEILDVMATKVTETEATALIATGIRSTFGADASAFVGRIASTYVDKDSAIAQDLGMVRSTLNGVSASISSIDKVVIEQGKSLSQLEVDTGVTLSNLQRQLDGSVSTYFYDYAPLMSNLPASDWTDENTRKNHVGDLFYDRTTGYGYRFAYEDITLDGVVNPEYSWITVVDVDVTAALANAARAQDTADGKRTVYYTSEIPSEQNINGTIIPIEVGDLWINRVTNITKVNIGIDQWVDITNTAAQNALIGMAKLEETNDGVVNTFYGTNKNVQTGMSYGDWFVDTDAVPIVAYRYEGTGVNAGKNLGVLSWVDNSNSILGKAMIESDIANKKIESVVNGTQAINVTSAKVTNPDGSVVALSAYVANEIDKEVVIASGTATPTIPSISPLSAATPAGKNNDIYIQKTTATGASGVSVDVVNTWKYVTDRWVMIGNNDNLTGLADLVDGKRTIYSNAGTSVPSVGLELNDMWIPSSSSTIVAPATVPAYVKDEIYIHKATGWTKATKYTDDTAVNDILTGKTSLNDAKIGTQTISAYISSATTASTANMVHVYSGTTAEKTAKNTASGVITGDLFVETTGTGVDAVTTTYRWSGTAWVEIEGASNVKALADLTDGKRSIFTTNHIPNNADAAGDLAVALNDLWMPSVDIFSTATPPVKLYRKGDIYICSSISPTIVFSLATDYYTLINNVQSQVDGKVDTFYQATIPVIASGTEALHVGDYWFATADVFNTATPPVLTHEKGVVYKYTKVGSVYSWVLTADVTRSAFDAIDGKKTIFGGSTVPTTGQDKDLWIPKGYTGTAYTNGFVYQYNSTTSAWDSNVKYTDDTMATAMSQSIYSATAPTIATHKFLAEGDQWINTATNELKVYGKNATTGVFEWQTTTNAVANAAYTIATENPNIYNSPLGTTPVPVSPAVLHYGDMWVVTDRWYATDIDSTSQTVPRTATQITNNIASYGYLVKRYNGASWDDMARTAATSSALKWSAVSSKFITAPDGTITGWKMSDGSSESSKFTITADKFEIVAASGSVSSRNPFSVDATTGEIAFNGKVSFSSVTGAPPMVAANTNINVTTNLVPNNGWYDTGSHGDYLFSGSPTYMQVIGAGDFQEDTLLLDAGDEVYTPFITDLTKSYKISYAIKGGLSTSLYQTSSTVLTANSIPAPTAMSYEDDSVTAVITIRDAIGDYHSTISKTIDYSLLRVAADGNLLSTVPKITITNTFPVFTKSATAVISPASITLTTAIANITTPTYQWYKNNIAIAGATLSSYVVPSNNFTTLASNTYMCIVTGTMYGIAGQTRRDSIAVQRVDTGTTTYSALLSNQNISFAAPFGGYTGIDFTGGIVTAAVYLGSTQLTYGLSGANTFSISLVRNKKMSPLAVLDPTKWYLVQALVLPAGSTAGISFGRIQEADTLNIVFTMDDIVLSADTDSFFLGFNQALYGWISRVSIEVVNTDTISSIPVTSGNLTTALAATTTVIDGARIDTGTINASSIRSSTITVDHLDFSTPEYLSGFAQPLGESLLTTTTFLQSFMSIVNSGNAMSVVSNSSPELSICADHYINANIYREGSNIILWIYGSNPGGTIGVNCGGSQGQKYTLNNFSNAINIMISVMINVNTFIGTAKNSLISKVYSSINDVPLYPGDSARSLFAFSTDGGAQACRCYYSSYGFVTGPTEDIITHPSTTGGLASKIGKYFPAATDAMGMCNVYLPIGVYAIERSVFNSVYGLSYKTHDFIGVYGYYGVTPKQLYTTAETIPVVSTGFTTIELFCKVEPLDTYGSMKAFANKTFNFIKIG